MEKIVEVFKMNHYRVTKETTKAVEFENNQYNQVIYLLPNSEITVVLNPKTVEGHAELEEKSCGKRHNIAFRQFPKRRNKGKGSIYYGYGYKFQSDTELNSFLSQLSYIV